MGEAVGTDFLTMQAEKRWQAGLNRRGGCTQSQLRAAIEPGIIAIAKQRQGVLQRSPRALAELRLGRGGLTTLSGDQNR